MGRSVSPAVVVAAAGGLLDTAVAEVHRRLSLSNRGAIVCASLLAVVLVASLATAAQARTVWAPESTPYERSGWGIRPKAIVVGNSVCTVYPSGLRWRSWGGAVAAARGKVLDPSRGSGESCGEKAASVRPRAATVRLDRIRRCQGRWVYTHMTWSWKGYRNGVTFPLAC